MTTDSDQQQGGNAGLDQPSLTGGLETVAPAGDYWVLARKYRPQTFAEVVGQEALVRTLTNAFAVNRIAHAFILTGVRGVGKTTTARLIAKGLNCIGADGTGGRTIEPCGTCEHCRAIAEDRHLDVMEMDAASRTGVDDIREILDGVRYLPVSARFKVYIIDEVHMLSRHAFNALLKTLEEPPDRVKFVFATTEIRKVPVTVLSRCQRFDLRRIPAGQLIALLDKVAKAEGAKVAPDALQLLGRAADGSVRDGLSLLDQAISHGHGAIEVDQVRDMLGLADAGAIYDLFDAMLRGDVAAALSMFGEAYVAGADPLAILQDLLTLCHWLTRLKVAPDAAAEEAVADGELGRSQEMARGLSVAVLSRAWQMLLKGAAEVQTAPAAKPAAEMVLIRLAYAAELPPPGDIVKTLTQDATAATAAPSDPGPALPGPSAQMPAAADAPEPAAEPASEPPSFRALVALVGERREIQLKNELYHNVNLVRYEPGRVEFQLSALAPADLPGRLLKCLRAWFGGHWQVSVSETPSAALSLAEQDRREREQQINTAREHPLVQAALAVFPDAKIERVTPKDTGLDPAAPVEEDEPEDHDGMWGEQTS